MNTTPQGRPMVAPTSPHPPGRPQNSTSPLAPLPYGGEVELIATDELNNAPTQVAPGARSKQAQLDLLLLAAHVAQITGDAPGTLAVLVGSSVFEDGRR